MRRCYSCNHEIKNEYGAKCSFCGADLTYTGKGMYDVSLHNTPKFFNVYCYRQIKDNIEINKPTKIFFSFRRRNKKSFKYDLYLYYKNSFLYSVIRLNKETTDSIIYEILTTHKKDDILFLKNNEIDLYAYNDKKLGKLIIRKGKNNQPEIILNLNNKQYFGNYYLDFKLKFDVLLSICFLSDVTSKKLDLFNSNSQRK